VDAAREFGDGWLEGVGLESYVLDRTGFGFKLRFEMEGSEAFNWWAGCQFFPLGWLRAARMKEGVEGGSRRRLFADSDMHQMEEGGEIVQSRYFVQFR
jgi:hypothetical protein